MFKTCVPVIAFAALAFGGCGGGDDSSSAGSPEKRPAAQTRLTHGEYVAQANKICRDTDHASAEFVAKAAKIDRSDREAKAPIVQSALKTIRAGYDRLKALSPPAGDQAAVDGYLTKLDERLDLIAQAAAADRGGDRAGARKAATASTRVGDSQRPVVRRLGLDDCGKTF